MPIEWWEEEPAASDDEVRSRHADNAAAWEAAALRYTAQSERTVALLRAGGSSLHPVERAVLESERGPLERWCATAIHLQCASGEDTLSLRNEGVGRVVGVDFSQRHIDNARAVTAALGVTSVEGPEASVAWYRCDVLDTPGELDRTADLVYTGRGAIGWIHDLEAWARVVARLLADDGLLCLFDDHPTSYLFDPDEDELVHSGVGYFDSAAGGTGFSESFVAHLGLEADELGVTHDRVWTFADLFGALTGAGLEIVHLGEHPEAYWDAFPHLPHELRRRIPQTFSLLARRR